MTQASITFSLKEVKQMIDYMKFDVMWMDDVIATVDLRPANGVHLTLSIILIH